jgi:hypothetical protein
MTEFAEAAPHTSRTPPRILAAVRLPARNLIVWFFATHLRGDTTVAEKA